MDEAGHRGQGADAAEAAARPLRRHRLARGAVARARRGAARRRGRAQQHELPHRSPVRRVGHRRRSTIPRTSRPYLLQGGLDLPDREYYLAGVARAWPTSARSSPATSSRTLRAGRHAAIPTTAAAAVVALETQDGPRARHPRRVARRAQGEQPLARAPSFRRRRRVSTGTRSCPARGSTRSRSSSCGIRRPCAACRRSCAASRWRRGSTG